MFHKKFFTNVMKKQLLLSFATVAALAATAANPQLPEAAKLTKGEFVMPIESAYAEQGPCVNAPMKSPNANVFYQYPAGTFFGTGLVVEDGVYNYAAYRMGILKVRPYVDQTFTNLSSVAGTPSWTWSQWDTSVSQEAAQSYTAEGDELTVNYMQEFVAAPVMKIGSYDFGNCYYYSSSTGNSAANTYLASVGNLSDSFSDPVSDGYETVIPCAPTFAGTCTRQGGVGGFIYYTGSDDETGETWNWFGSNSPYDAMGMRIPNPGRIYALNAIYLYCFGYAESEVTLDVTIYQLLNPGEWYETEEGTTHLSTAEIGDVIATGSVEFPTDGSEEEPWEGMLKVTFTTEGGFEYSPEINEDVLVVVSGYNVPEMHNFSFLLGRDAYNCGVGSCAYLGYAIDPETSEPLMMSLEDFFRSGALYGAPSIYFDPTTAWLMSVYNIQPQEFELSTEGETVNTFSVEGYEGEEPLQLYSYFPSDDWDVTDENGDELPEWLTVSTTDEYSTNSYGEEYFNGFVDIEIAADALPEGVAGRSCTIMFKSLGAEPYYITVKQGEAVGIEGIQAGNANVVAVEYYNLQGQRLNAAPENGVYIVKNVLSNGKTVAAKVVK